MKPYEPIARQMLELKVFQDIPEELLRRLRRIDYWVSCVGGELHSRQVIASVIEVWEREQGTK